MSLNGDQPIMFLCYPFKGIYWMFKNCINSLLPEHQQELGAWVECCGVKINPRLININNWLVNYALHWHWAILWCQFIITYFEQKFTMIFHSVTHMNHYFRTSPPRTKILAQFPRSKSQKTFLSFLISIVI